MRHPAASVIRQMTYIRATRSAALEPFDGYVEDLSDPRPSDLFQWAARRRNAS